MYFGVNISENWNYDYLKVPSKTSTGGVSDHPFRHEINICYTLKNDN